MSTVEVTKPKAAKPVTKKRAKPAPKAKKVEAAKTAKTASHPPYFEMIKEALVALHERNGSSPYAIAKYMEEKHKAVLPANFRKILGLQIKNSALKGKLIKIKASYKLSESGKKEKAAAAKPAPKKPATVVVQKTKASAGGTKRKAESVKKVAAKKVAKKATPTKAKQPKSIKSPAAKKAKRATAA